MMTLVLVILGLGLTAALGNALWPWCRARKIEREAEKRSWQRQANANWYEHWTNEL